MLIVALVLARILPYPNYFSRPEFLPAYGVSFLMALILTPPKLSSLSYLWTRS